jgi:2-keto-4-pentenoate hydratase/2-oxohepta-3-ene-1,7-dioic acid hydratase in catechol pathway
LKFAAFKLKNEPQRVRVGQVSDDLSQIEEFSIDADLSEQGVVGILKAGHESLKRAAKHSISDLILCAPVPRPRRNIFCVGKNYFEHAKEFSGSGFDSSMTKPGDDIPQDPIIFTKVPESVVATGSQVLIPKNVSTAIDYEAELAVIIGRQAKGVSEADAMKYVWGYTIVNDVTSRDWQSRHKQWHMGKSFDTFCPMGPWVVTADECDGQSVDVKCYVNGELRQNSNSKDLIFNIPKLIATLSAGITLYPGDIIATGTPVGVGIGFKPPKYLVDGDVVKVEIEKIGFIENTFKAI